MNRRQFTQALAAVFATPALPSMAALAPAGGTLPPAAYFWADYMTRLHNRCTAEMLAPFFRADAETAKALHSQLVAENFLTSTGHAHPDLLARQPAKTFGQRDFNTAKSQQTQPQKSKAKPTMQDPEIRKAQATDHDALTEIWHAGWVESHADHVPAELTQQRTKESFHIRLKDMLENTFVTGEIGAPIGFCAIKNNEIYQMYVSPAARGTNAAKALIQTGCDAIAKAGHAQAKLDVIAPNDRAQAFYRKMGFVSHGLQSVELDTLGDPFALNCVVMVKELE